jgi:hypothetical protein
MVGVIDSEIGATDSEANCDNGEKNYVSNQTHASGPRSGSQSPGTSVVPRSYLQSFSSLKPAER